MKSFSQLTEDIEARRQQLKQRSQERMQRFKDQSASSLASAKQKADEVLNNPEEGKNDDT